MNGREKRGRTVVNEIIIGVVVFLCTGVLTGIFILLQSQIKRLFSRINHLMLCNFAIFEAFKEQGINGEVKKEFDRLKEQVVKD